MLEDRCKSIINDYLGAYWARCARVINGEVFVSVNVLLLLYIVGLLLSKT